MSVGNFIDVDGYYEIKTGPPTPPAPAPAPALAHPATLPPTLASSSPVQSPVPIPAPASSTSNLDSAQDDDLALPRRSISVADPYFVCAKKPDGQFSYEQLLEDLKTNERSRTSLTLSRYLKASRLNQEQLLTIVSTLKENHTLQKMDLKHCGLDPKFVIALAQSIKNHSSLGSLVLAYNGLGSEGIESLLKVLVPPPNPHYFESGLYCTLHTLILSRTSMGLSAFVALGHVLKSNKSLVHVDVSENSANNQGIAAFVPSLHDNATLTRLNLAKNSFNEVAANIIAQMLAVNRSLRKLDVTLNHLGDQGVQYLADSLHHNSQFAELIMGAVGMSDPGLLAISKMIRVNKSLTTLDIRANQAEAQGFKQLCEGLQQDNRTLRRLDMSWTIIDQPKAKIMSSCLSGHPSLTALYLSNCQINDKCLSHILKIIKPPSRHSPAIQGIRSFDLSLNLISAKACQQVANVLAKDTPLATLNLRANAFGDEGVMRLIEGLSKNHHLTQLDLSQCLVANAATVEALHKLATSNPTLCYLGKFYPSQDPLTERITNVLKENRRNWYAQRRLPLCLGLHPKIGMFSPVRRSLALSPIFERNVLGIVWSYLENEDESVLKVEQ